MSKELDIHQCARSGNAALFSKLILYTDINSINSVGYTPLHYACFYGHDKIVEIICKNDVDLNIRNLSGKTPFYLAVENNQLHIVEILLQLCDISIPDRNGFTVLHQAIVNNNFAMVKLLISANTKDEIWIDIQAKGLMVYGEQTPGELGKRYFTILDYCNKYKTDEIKDYLFPKDEIIIIEIKDDLQEFEQIEYRIENQHIENDFNYFVDGFV